MDEDDALDTPVGSTTTSPRDSVERLRLSSPRPEMSHPTARSPNKRRRKVLRREKGGDQISEETEEEEMEDVSPPPSEASPPRPKRKIPPLVPPMGVKLSKLSNRGGDKPYLSNSGSPMSPRVNSDVTYPLWLMV